MLELEQMNITFLVKLGKSVSEIREMLVQVYGDNAMKKTAGYKWVTRFSEGRESVTDKERSGQPATSRTEESSSNCALKLLAGCKEHSRAIKHQQRNRKILTEDLDMRKISAKMVPKDLLTWHCL
jgi:transposase